MNKYRKTLAFALLAIGGALIVYCLSTNGGDTVVADWEPVNGALETALDKLDGKPESLATGTPEKAATEPKASPLPSTPVPASGVEESARPTPDNKISAADPAAERRLDLNKANEADLENLPGIGPSKAKAILSYREERRGFRSPNELLDVKGIGPKLYEKIEPLVTAR